MRTLLAITWVLRATQGFVHTSGRVTVRGAAVARQSKLQLPHFLPTSAREPARSFAMSAAAAAHSAVLSATARSYLKQCLQQGKAEVPALQVGLKHVLLHTCSRCSATISFKAHLPREALIGSSLSVLRICLDCNVSSLLLWVHVYVYCASNTAGNTKAEWPFT
jgi:hypothetical protein